MFTIILAVVAFLGGAYVQYRFNIAKYVPFVNLKTPNVA